MATIPNVVVVGRSRRIDPRHRSVQLSAVSDRPDRPDRPEPAERHEVTTDEEGLRVDVWLTKRFAGIGRASAKTLLESGGVRLNGRRAKKGDRVAAGMAVELASTPRPAQFDALPDPSLVLVVRYEDDALIVVDKPARMPSHPLDPDELGTVANALVARCPELATVGFSRREPGLVHRLDVDTSGLIVAAKTTAAFDALVASLREGRWDKRYQALVDGSIRSRLPIDAAIANHPSDPAKVRVTSDPLESGRLRARSARTEVRPLESLRATTLVEAIAHRAVRHQVRAHLASVGHPLVGDTLYGGPADEALGRHFLHASHLAFPHPTTGATITIDSPLPSDLDAALARHR